ncbi:MAG: hypothetical protein FJX22_02915 [Alphaproteobacteria bacterium]|nr:hypothetical protein [Alphaproteobacteria bacterium]
MDASLTASFAGNVVKAVTNFVTSGNPYVTVPAVTLATALVVGTGLAHALNEFAGLLDPTYRERPSR